MGSRQSSAIMTDAQYAKAEKAKEKEAAKQKVKDQKAELKDLKHDVVQCKKEVAVMMKSFLETPDKDAAKSYKEAVATHIKTVQQVTKLAAKLS